MELTWDFTFIDFVVIVGIIILAVVFLFTLYFVRRKHREEIDHKFFRNRWTQIQDLLKQGKEMNHKLAIIEADKLLDYALKALGFPGNTIAERLQFASYQRGDLKHVWWAHKVRNMVVHDVKYELSAGETRKVVKAFEAALKSLHCL